MPLGTESMDSASTLSGPTSDDAHSRATSTASKRFASAPFLLQSQLGRRAPGAVAELLVVDTPPSHRTNPHIHTLSPPQQLRAIPAMSLNSTDRTSPLQASAPPPPRPAPVAIPRFTQETSETSTAPTGTTYTPLTNASAPSMPYTWTDSYLEESPEATRTRWIRRQTFGPVLQSEGGGSSTVVSTPRAVRQEGEMIWGGVLDRNAAARERGRAESSRPSTASTSVEDELSRVAGVGAGCRGVVRYPPQQQQQQHRRFNLDAAERTGVGLGRAPPPPHSQPTRDDTAGGAYRAAPRIFPGASSTAKDLFPATSTAIPSADTFRLSAAPHHLLSDVSTVVATVQQSKRGAQIAPVEKPSPPPPPPASTQQQQQEAAFLIGPSYTTDSSNKNVYAYTSVAVLSPTIPLDAPELRAARDATSPQLQQLPRSPTTAAAAREVQMRVSGRTASSRSSSAGDNVSCEMAEASTSDLARTAGERLSRSGPIRRRVLKPLYDD